MGGRLQHIPTSLITGYPGAGKTTAIRRLIEHRPERERWAVLLNDSSPSAADGSDAAAMRAEKNVSVSTIPGGCICCTARVGLRVALIQLLRSTRPQRLLIKAAGLAHPAAVLATLRDPWFAEALDLRASICVADPRQFADPKLAASETYREQFQLADVIVASQRDQASAAQLQALLDYARALRPLKVVVRLAGNGELPLELLELAPA